MSIHTIISQMEDEFDKKFCEYLSLKTLRLLSSKHVSDKKGKYINNFRKGILPHKVKLLFRSFATRIVEAERTRLLSHECMKDEPEIVNNEAFNRYDEGAIARNALRQSILSEVEKI